MTDDALIEKVARQTGLPPIYVEMVISAARPGIQAEVFKQLDVSIVAASVAKGLPIWFQQEASEVLERARQELGASSDG